MWDDEKLHVLPSEPQISRNAPLSLMKPLRRVRKIRRQVLPRFGFSAGPISNYARPNGLGQSGDCGPLIPAHVQGGSASSLERELFREPDPARLIPAGSDQRGDGCLGALGQADDWSTSAESLKGTNALIDNDSEEPLLGGKLLELRIHVDPFASSAREMDYVVSEIRDAVVGTKGLDEHTGMVGPRPGRMNDRPSSEAVDRGYRRYDFQKPQLCRPSWMARPGLEPKRHDFQIV